MRLRSRTGPPKRAPEKLDSFDAAQLDTAITERLRYVEQTREEGAAIPAAEREEALQALRETTDDLKRMQAERSRRQAAPPVKTSHSPQWLPDFSPGAARSIKEAREAGWEKRRREEAERRAEALRHNEERQAEKRRQQAKQGLGPPEPGAWSGLGAGRGGHPRGRGLRSVVVARVGGPQPRQARPQPASARGRPARAARGAGDARGARHTGDRCLVGRVVVVAAGGVREVAVERGERGLVPPAPARQRLADRQARGRPAVRVAWADG